MWEELGGGLCGWCLMCELVASNVPRKFWYFVLIGVWIDGWHRCYTRITGNEEHLFGHVFKSPSSWDIHS